MEIASLAGAAAQDQYVAAASCADVLTRKIRSAPGVDIATGPLGGG
jgi:hypothetical protein